MSEAHQPRDPIAEIARIQEGLRVLRCPDGRSFIVAGTHYIPRKFIWRVVIEYCMGGSLALVIEGVGDKIEIIDVPTGRATLDCLVAMKNRIIELWIEE